MLRAGISGWMADFGEALPMDACMHDGTTGGTWHNKYPAVWAALNQEAIAEAVRAPHDGTYIHTPAPPFSCRLQLSIGRASVPGGGIGGGVGVEEEGETFMRQERRYAIDAFHLRLPQYSTKTAVERVLKQRELAHCLCCSIVTDDVISLRRHGNDTNKQRTAVEAEAARDAWIFTRAAAVGSLPHLNMQWLGDQLTSWDAYDGLASVLPASLSSGFSGLSLVHSDIGGCV
jgi:hypothetical protein